MHSVHCTVFSEDLLHAASLTFNSYCHFVLFYVFDTMSVILPALRFHSNDRTTWEGLLIYSPTPNLVCI